MSLEDAYAAWAEDLVGYATVLVGHGDAADLVADTFAQVLSRASTGWTDARDARGYLFGAVANRARMTHRSTGRLRAREQRHLALASSDGRSGPSDSDRYDDRIGPALDVLSTQQRAVVYLAYWEDLTAEDIALVLGVSSGTVRKQLARSRARLREVLS